MLPSRDLYLTFGGAADGYAIPSRLVRMASDPGSGVVAAAQFRPVG
jgi:transposase